jgi:hypothetical protein
MGLGRLVDPVLRYSQSAVLVLSAAVLESSPLLALQGGGYLRPWSCATSEHEHEHEHEHEYEYEYEYEHLLVLGGEVRSSIFLAGRDESHLAQVLVRQILGLGVT